VADGDQHEPSVEPRPPFDHDYQLEQLIIGRALLGHPVDRRLRSWHFTDREHQRIFVALLVCGGWTGGVDMMQLRDTLRAARVWYGAEQARYLLELATGAECSLEPDVVGFVRNATRRLAAQRLAWLAAGVRRGDINYAQMRAEMDAI